MTRPEVIATDSGSGKALLPSETLLRLEALHARILPNVNACMTGARDRPVRQPAAEKLLLDGILSAPVPLCGCNRHDDKGVIAPDVRLGPFASMRRAGTVCAQHQGRWVRT